MIERVIENWLDKASEKSYQLPFCFMLADKGYTIYHLTRHCPMELGKDVIAKSPDGKVCAFQLKGGSTRRITIGNWTKNIKSQVVILGETSIDHPSLSNNEIHIPYFVTNKELDEEVWSAINSYNSQRRKQGKPELKVLSRGDLLEYFKDCGLSFIPSEIKDYRSLLDLHLRDGRKNLDKDNLSGIFELLFDLDCEDNKSRAECLRRVSSGAIICSIATYRHSVSGNHFAEIEAWVIYYSYVLSLCIRNNLDFKDVESEVFIAREKIFNSLLNLCDEIIDREHYTEGEIMSDSPVYPIRMTILKGLMSILGLAVNIGHHNLENKVSDEQYSFISSFLSDSSMKMELWGESALPYFLSCYWFFRSHYAGISPEKFLQSILNRILNKNMPKSRDYLLPPYYGPDIIAESNIKSQLSQIIPTEFIGESDVIDEEVRGRSYYIPSIVRILARRNLKRYLKSAWPQISKFTFNRFRPYNSSDFFRWRCPRGANDTLVPELTKEWSKLLEASRMDQGNSVPDVLKEDPIMALIFLIVYPHRISPDYTNWLDSQFCNICW